MDVFILPFTAEHQTCAAWLTVCLILVFVISRFTHYPTRRAVYPNLAVDIDIFTDSISFSSTPPTLK